MRERADKKIAQRPAVLNAFARTLAIALLAAPACAPLLRGQELSPDEVQRIASYYKSWEGAALGQPASPGEAARLETALHTAQQEFRGRGPALARYFLNHVQASPSNTAFFFLFRAVGDADTASLLIRSLLDPPVPAGGVIGRDPSEIGIAIEAVLQNDSARTNPGVLAALEDTLQRARNRPGGIALARNLISILGKCRTARAAQLLQTLASDADPSIRSAAVAALGEPGLGPATQTLERALAQDSAPEARARAADSLARSQAPGAARALQAALANENDPGVADAILRALAALGALPQNPADCLQTAGRAWEASTARAAFDCWRAAASREDLMQQASSGPWTVRALALHSLADSLPPVPVIRQPLAPPVLPLTPVPGAISAGAQSGSALQAPAAAALDPDTRQRLLQSSVELLSQKISALPAPGALSYSTMQLVRDAFWEISGHNMAVALEFADRIVPLHGSSLMQGRFGESYDLASRDAPGYAAARRPLQLLLAGAAALLVSLLLLLKPLRPLAVAMLAALGGWAVWSAYQTGVKELPPPPLCFLTVSSLAFLCAGLVAGFLALARIRAWLKVAASFLLAGICALLVCGLTRSLALFPTGSEGWELIFDPLASAVLAAPVALVLSLGMLAWKRREPASQPGPGRSG